METIAGDFRGDVAETIEELGLREFARLRAPQGMKKLKKPLCSGDISRILSPAWNKHVNTRK